MTFDPFDGDFYEDTLPHGWDDLSEDERETLIDAYNNGTLDAHPSLSAADRNPSLCR